MCVNLNLTNEQKSLREEFIENYRKALQKVSKQQLSVSQRAEVISSLPTTARYSGQNPAHLAYTISSKGVVKTMRAKSAKLVKRWLPEGIAFNEYDMNKVCTFLRDKNTRYIASDFKQLPSVYPKLQGQIIPYTMGMTTGSCMERTLNREVCVAEALSCRKHRWAELNDVMYDGLSYLPSSNPEEGVQLGASTLIWREAKHLTEGNVGAIRAFLWPIINTDGSTGWYIDRAYPSTPAVREFITAFASARGWECYDDTGAGCTNYTQLGGFSHELKEYLDDNVYLPWMDSFVSVEEGDNQLQTHKLGGGSNAQTTSGEWFENNHQYCECCESNVECGEEDMVYDDSNYRNICPSCFEEYYSSCDYCCNLMLISDALVAEDGRSFCDYNCACSAEYSTCERCGELHPESGGHYAEDAFYCSDYCAKEEGLKECDKCGTYHNEDDIHYVQAEDICEECISAAFRGVEVSTTRAVNAEAIARELRREVETMVSRPCAGVEILRASAH